jgi:hypothetical protein
VSNGWVVVTFLQDHLSPEWSGEIATELGRESLLEQFEVTPLGLVSRNGR